MQQRPQPKLFSGKCGIITGAASGIGRATALHLAGAGAGLCLVDWDETPLKQVAERIRDPETHQPFTRKMDVSSEADVAAMVQDTLDVFGRIDFLITCAGILRRTAFGKITPAEWDLMLSINLKGPFLCCRGVVPAMTAQGGGVIVNVSSLAGRTASVLGGAHYTAAKHGVIGLTRHMARELGPMGIRVNAFCPGATLTPMVDNTTSIEERNRIAEAMPLRRWADPEEQAEVIAFLLSDAAGFITGACIDSNGGAVMM